MRYSEYPVSNEPRSFRVTFGSLLAIAGLTYGLFVAVPQLQRSFVMQPMAEPLSWAELIQRGLADNAHIQLNEVDVPSDEGQLLALQKMIAELDPQGDRAVMQQEIQDSLRGVDPMQLLQQASTPMKVIPRGIEPNRVPPVIVMSRFDTGLPIARSEIATSGSISGYVRKGWDLAWCNQVLRYLGEKSPQFDLEKRPRFVISPVISVPERRMSIGVVVASGLVAALGLVMAGSGGPSILSCLFMPLPSMISMLGFPLRYGRGGRFVRSLYLLVGLAGLVGGGYLAWYPGGLTQIGGDTLLQSLGFVAITLGAAGIIGSRLSARSAPAIERYENAATYTEPEQGFSIEKIAMLQSKEEPKPTDEYSDPRLSDASEMALPALMDDQVGTLCATGFHSPKQILIHDDQRRQLAAIMLGCHQIVLGEVVENGKSTLTRLVSVLSDGLVVITLSASTPRVSPLRVGVNGVYSRAKTDSPIDMLPEHLDRTVSIAEERHAQVVSFDDYERLDVFLLARRVLMDIQNEYKESKWKVSGASYGRFAFPGRSIELLVKS